MSVIPKQITGVARCNFTTHYVVSKFLFMTGTLQFPITQPQILDVPLFLFISYGCIYLGLCLDLPVVLMSARKSVIFIINITGSVKRSTYGFKWAPPELVCVWGEDGLVICSLHL